MIIYTVVGLVGFSGSEIHHSTPCMFMNRNGGGGCADYDMFRHLQFLANIFPPQICGV